MSKVRIFALGGLDEDGKNMYVVENGNDIFVMALIPAAEAATIARGSASGLAISTRQKRQLPGRNGSVLSCI